ncbi:hypothetical protein [Pseudophaeobacter sp. EL27]|uniref:hypothetical protein n=1 Tax=Pseudophaeobacter sp. EL27 TaxID=2107580 RepID=UPI000EFB70FF|nr:hypothetical protein [Pseudophaeobacter sp. EL27]
METEDFRHDPIKDGFFPTTSAAKLAAIQQQDTGFGLAAWVFELARLGPGIRFFSRHEHLEIAGVCPDQHCDLGPNGARGTAANIARTGEQANLTISIRMPSVMAAIRRVSLPAWKWMTNLARLWVRHTFNAKCVRHP